MAGGPWTLNSCGSFHARMEMLWSWTTVLQCTAHGRREVHVGRWGALPTGQSAQRKPRRAFYLKSKERVGPHPVCAGFLDHHVEPTASALQAC